MTRETEPREIDRLVAEHVRIDDVSKPRNPRWRVFFGSIHLGDCTSKETADSWAASIRRELVEKFSALGVAPAEEKR